MNRIIRKYTINQHNEIKDELIRSINGIIDNDPNAVYAKMSHSDYDLDYQSNYKDVARNVLTPYLKHYAKSWHFDSINFKNIWFASYRDGATFGWHSHEGCNMSGVYMLKLPDPKSATQLWGTDFNEEIFEGDLLVFPSMLPHRSPVINNEEKIVIAFNWDIYSCDM